MEKITRNNVEAWMLDYQEGNLSDERISDLLAFLESNPDLDIDPDFSDFPTLEAPELTYSGVSDLFRTDLNLPDLSEDEIDCIGRIEGDMISSEEKAFDESLESDPKKAILFKSLKQTILNPDTRVSFKDKNDLKRKVILIPRFVYGLISTAAVLIFAWFIFSPGEVIQEQPLLAKDTSRQIIYLDKIANPSQFEKVAINNPEKVLSPPETKPIIEMIVNREPDLAYIVPARRLPPGLINTSLSISDKSFVFIYRTLPSPEDIEYQTLLAYTGSVLRERILGQDADFVKKNKFSFWELADVGINQVSSLFSVPVALNRKYNKDGNLESITFDSRLVAFSTPVNGQRNR